VAVRTIAGLTGLIGVALCGGCPIPSGGTTSDDDPLIYTDFDGFWQITSETGLINNCITILGDRVTRASECDGSAYSIVDSDLSVRSANQIIWTFVTSDSDEGQTRHTLSVYIQADGSLRGSYSLRLPDALFALTDNIIMVRRTVRI
jgi:hypothetical protein